MLHFLCIKPFQEVIRNKHEYIIGVAVIHKNILITILSIVDLCISLQILFLYSIQALNKVLSQSLPTNNDQEFVSKQFNNILQNLIITFISILRSPL